VAIGVDFDGVIHAYRSGWLDGSVYDGPLPGALEGLRELMAWEPVFILTSRDPAQVAAALAAFARGEGGEEFVVRVDGEGGGGEPVKFWNEMGVLLVTNRKLPARAYLDDRAVTFTSWPQALRALTSTSR